MTTDEEYLDSIDHPVDLEHLSAPASGAVNLDAEWVAYLDDQHLPSHVAGVDPHLHHEDSHHEGDVGYA